MMSLRSQYNYFVIIVSCNNLRTLFYYLIRALNVTEFIEFEINIFNNNTVRDYPNRFTTDNQDKLIAQLSNIMSYNNSYTLLIEPVNMYLNHCCIALHSLSLVD